MDSTQTADVCLVGSSFHQNLAVSLEQAEAKRQDQEDHQGTHECEVWAEGHEGSVMWEACKKNSGHDGFTPAPLFHAGLLPSPYDKDQDAEELVKTVAELTVRLRVGYTSMNRPDGYPFSKFKGINWPHTGSGFVSDGSFFEASPVPGQLESKMFCPCKLCDTVVPPRRRKSEWWNFAVRTVKHVVYDSEEARNTVADVYLDEPGQESSKFCLYGCEVAKSHLDGDISRIVVATHDEVLAQKLQLSIKHYNFLLCRTHRKYRDPEKFPLYIVICSHPHGFSKQITVGRRINKRVVNHKVEGAQINEEWTEYTYTTPTCAGSSGAPVLILGREQISGRQWFFLTHSHRQTLCSGQGHSGIMFECFKNTDEPVSNKSKTMPI